MIKELIKLADHLDKKGFYKEANYIDNILKIAGESASQDNLQKNNQYLTIKTVPSMKALDYIRELLEDSNGIKECVKGGFLKKGIYKRFDINYYKANSKLPRGDRFVQFSVKVHFVNEDGTPYDGKNEAYASKFPSSDLLYKAWTDFSDKHIPESPVSVFSSKGPTITFTVYYWAVNISLKKFSKLNFT